MAFQLTLFNNQLVNVRALKEVLVCNDLTSRYGLSLTKMQALELIKIRGDSLRANGRIEFGGGIIDKIIKVFCDSDYLSQENYAETLGELLEIFYYYKNEALDDLSDDELIDLMKNYFDGTCAGSLELLRNRELDKEARDIRRGHQLSDLYSDSKAVQGEYDYE